MIIYKATNKINNKIYIGQTVNSLEVRKKNHERSGKSKSCHSIFDFAIQKYGKENFEWEILEECSNLEELNKRESYYIETFNSTDKKIGYNLKGGGDNAFLTDDVKEKIGKAQKGSLNHMYGKKGKDNPSSKRVVNLTTGIIYNSATECAEKENAEISKICAVCRGERKSHKNNQYAYIDENGNPIIKVELKKKIRCIETGKVFLSLTEASIKTYGNKSEKANILRACKRKIAVKNLHWEYI